MNTSDARNPNDKELWRLYAQAPPAPSAGCPSAADLAAYVDGRISKKRRRAIESHLAECDSCLEAICETSELRTEHVQAMIPAPPQVIEAAKALVSESSRPAVKSHQTGWRIADWLAMGRIGAAAAASLAICILGYLTGERSFAADGAAANELVPEMTFGVFSSSEQLDTEYELFALTNEEDQR